MVWGEGCPAARSRNVQPGLPASQPLRNLIGATAWTRASSANSDLIQLVSSGDNTLRRLRVRNCG